MLIRSILIIAVTWLCAGCMHVRQAVKAPLGTDGELFLYCEPFPQEAGRLEFSVETISAIRDDGLAVPLTADVKEFTLAGMRRQRLVSRDVLPPGHYTAIAIKLKNAALSGEDGQVRLLVPERPYENRALFRFKAARRPL